LSAVTAATSTTSLGCLTHVKWNLSGFSFHGTYLDSLFVEPLWILFSWNLSGFSFCDGYWRAAFGFYQQNVVPISRQKRLLVSDQQFVGPKTFAPKAGFGFRSTICRSKNFPPK
jgi:hypothetical protein